MNVNAQRMSVVVGRRYRFFRSLLFRTLRGVRVGQITISDPERSEVFGTAPNPGVDRVTHDRSDTPVPSSDELNVHIQIYNPKAYADMCLRGSVGAADAYVRGDWQTNDLLGLMRIMANNIDTVDKMESGLSRVYTGLLKVSHFMRRNTKKGSSQNIGAHYDLSNDFFSLFLDREMMYSSAIYPDDSSDLDAAAVHKLDVICRKLDLRQDHHLLEIGTGWGGLAIYAAQHYGCRVTTTTISQAQFDYALQRVHQLGLDSQITVLKRDYRDLEGQYDRLVSVEMIEAVGHAYVDTFFSTCNRLLKDDGRMLIQAITIAEHRYARASREVDFIQRYIFPGGALPSLASMSESIARVTSLQPHHLESYPDDYARTLASWRQRFFARLDEVRHLGFDDQFIRLWDLYLNYCEGGFRENTISLLHLVLTGPRHPLAVSRSASRRL